VGPNFAVREVVLDRDVRAPEMLSASTVSRGYLVRRFVSVCILAAIDVVSLCVAVALASHVMSYVHGPVRVFLPWHLAVIAIALLAVFAVHQLYGLRARRHDRKRRLRAALWVLVVALALNGIASVWVPFDVVVAWLMAIGLSTAGRELYDFALGVVFGVDLEAKRTILLGSDDALRAFADLRRRTPRLQANVIGVVGEATPDHALLRKAGVPSLGLLGDLERIVECARADELLVVDREIEVRHLVGLADLCRRHTLTLKLADLEMRFRESGVCLVPGLDEPLFVSAPSRHSGTGWLLKRSIDVVVAALLLVILSPLLAVVALAIKLTSLGPVFYVAPRVGLGQRPFRCYKFRTMVDDADRRQASLEAHNEADGAIFKIEQDPRVTAIGRPLRAASIDELPQLINVLRGEMSLVGPRPLPLRDNELLAAWHKQRHVVLPGMTGLWQIRGDSAAYSFAEMIRLDLKYIERWSVWLDLTILAKTAGATMRVRGAH
jgi:exopolysaccharide biosynthesis polyprenyl glycosylphosphotransferase